MLYLNGLRAALVSVALLMSSETRASSLAWSGGFNNRWSFFAGFPNSNWNGSLPAGGDDVLSFPPAGLNKVMDNDFPDNTKFAQLHFTGAGYTLGGNQLELARDLATDTDPEIAVTHGAGTTIIDVPIILGGILLPVSVTNAAATLEFQSVFTNTNGTVNVIGQGTVLMSGPANRAYTGSLGVGTGSDSPTAILNLPISGNVRVRAGATLAGRGTFGDAAGDTLIVDGTLIPGDPAGGPFGAGPMTAKGSLQFSTTAEVFFDLVALGGGGADRIDVAATVTTGSAIVNLLPTRGFPIGTIFTLISNEGTDAIVNTLPFRLPNSTVINEGSETTIGVNRFRFSYTGGTGNDFTATVVAAPSSGVREWDAGGSTQLFSEAANWSANLLPIASNTLRFGTAAPAAPLTERFPINDLGGNFFKLEFTAGGYALEEPSSDTSLTDLTLSGGIAASHPSGGVTFEQDIFLGAAQTFALTDAGFMRFGLNHTIDTEDFDLTVNNSGTGEMRFNGPIVDGGRLIKTGSGFVTMGGASTSTYTGGTLVNQGELRLSRSSVNGAVPAGDLTIGGAGMSAKVTTTAVEQIADVAVVSVQVLGSLEPGAAETIAALNLDGGSVSGTGVLAVAGNITASDSALISAPIQINGSVRDWNVAAGRTVQMSGALTVSPASTGVTMRKMGPGILRLAGTAANTTIAMEGGELRMDGTNPNTLSVSLRGGLLDGTGRVHEITGTATGGEISPGVPGATPLDSSGSLGCARLNLNAASRVAIDIAGTLAGVSFDLLSVTAGTSTGQVTLNNAQLVLRQTTSVPVASVLLIVDNDGTDAVSGTFAGLPQGAVVSSARNSYTINYAGGTGNDIVLTAIAAPEISVEFNSTALTDGADTAFLGAVLSGGSITGTFTVRNLGTSVLNLTGNPRVQVGGVNAAFFTVTTQPPATVAAGTSTTFVVRFAPTFGGFKEATLTIPNNDTDENPFNIRVTGSAGPVPAITAQTVTQPSGGNPGTVNLTIAASNPNISMRLEASSNLTAWTLLKTFSTDAIGGAVTGVTIDPGSTSGPRRFYRAIIP